MKMSLDQGFDLDRSGRLLHKVQNVQSRQSTGAAPFDSAGQMGRRSFVLFPFWVNPGPRNDAYGVVT